MRDELRKWATSYPTQPEHRDPAFKGSPLRTLVCDNIPRAIQAAMPQTVGLLIKGSIGKGGWTDTPWVALLDAEVTDTVEDGLYIVYLLSLGGERLYLTIAQGCTDLKDSLGGPAASAELQRRAELLRTRIAGRMDRLAPIEMRLESRSWRGKLYEAGIVAAVGYETDALPSEADLLADLNEALTAYRTLVPLARWHSDSEALREAFEDIGPCTVEEAKRYRQHRSIERKAKNSRAVKKALGTRCMGCENDLADIYGPVAKGLIEAHHKRPLSSLLEGEAIKYDVYDDFAVLCPNCHRVIHRMNDPSDLKELRDRVTIARSF